MAKIIDYLTNKLGEMDSKTKLETINAIMTLCTKIKTDEKLNEETYKLREKLTNKVPQMHALTKNLVVTKHNYEHTYQYVQKDIKIDFELFTMLLLFDGDTAGYGKTIIFIVQNDEYITLLNSDNAYIDDYDNEKIKKVYNNIKIGDISFKIFKEYIVTIFDDCIA
jgi:hypothetical protein